MIFCVVTYNQPQQLDRLYSSLWHTWGVLDKNNLIIINNHSNFKNPGPSKVFHNDLRSDDSIGYLSRSWNQCLLQGFGSSVAPLSDWVCLVQSDVVFQPGWKQRFLQNVEKQGSRFVACGPGDQATFIHIDAFREIGWWDERFCGIGYQEFDYFVRAYLRLGDRCAIQGHGGALTHNWNGLNLIARQREHGSGHTSRANPMLYAHLVEKWGDEICRHLETGDPALIVKWRDVIDLQFKEKPLPKEYNWYPHFYMDDERDYSHLYKAYTPLKRRSLDIKIHGFGWTEEPRPLDGVETRQLPVRVRIKRALGRAVGRLS